MQFFCLKYKGKEYFYQSDDEWKTFEEIKQTSFNCDLSVESVKKRCYKIAKNKWIVSSNFWKSYRITKKIDETFIDDSKNKKVASRYTIVDNEYIVTDDFWSTFYFSKYAGKRILDNSKVLRKRITVIENNSKIVETEDFYKTTKDIYKNSLESNEKRTAEIKSFFSKYEHMIDSMGSNAQKKCLCYKKYSYNIGKVLMLKLDELHLSDYDIHNKNDGYGSEFEIFASQRLIKNFKYNKNIVAGSRDGKIDAVGYSDDENNVSYFQIKFLTEIKAYDIKLMSENSVKASNSVTYEDLSSDAEDLKKFMEKNSEYFDKNYEINIVSDFVFDASIVDGNIHKIIVDGNEYEFRYIDSSNLIYKFVDDYLKGIVGNKTINLPTNKKMIKALNCDSYFMFISAKELCERIAKTYSTREEVDELFINNVRGYLGANYKILKTIEEKPENFALYNNGVSICCKNIEYNSRDSFIKIDRPCVVNGQQTILSLYSSFENGNSLDNIEVPLFIKPYKNDEKEMLNIAIYNNTQKPVKDIDLLCADINVRKISKIILEYDSDKYKYDFKQWLSLKMFSTGVNSNIEITSLVIPKNNIIAVNDYFKILLPILYHYRSQNEVNMHLENFNKNTTKYKENYDELTSVIETVIEEGKDLLFNVAVAAYEARIFVNAAENNAYLPAENFFGIPHFYGIDFDELKNKLDSMGFNQSDDKKDKIDFVSKSVNCKIIQEFIVNGKRWIDYKIVDDNECVES